MSTTLWLRDTTANGVGGGYRDLLQSGPGSVAFPGTALDMTPGSGGSGSVLWGVWITGYPDEEFTLDGDIYHRISAGESTNSLNAGIGVEIYKRSINGTETLIDDFPRSGELTTTSADRQWTDNPPSTVIGVTDRLVFKFYAYPQGGATFGSGFVRMRYDAVADASQGESFVTIAEDVIFNADPPSGSTYEESAALGVSVAAGATVANVLSLTNSIGMSLAAAQAYLFAAEAAVAFAVTLDKTLATQAQLLPTSTFEMVLGAAATPELVLNFTVEFATALELTQVGGTLYGAAVEFAVLLNQFVVPSAAYDDTLVFGLSLGAEAADNLGDIELSVAWELVHDVSFERGRVWDNVITYATTLALTQAPGNIIDFSLTWNLSLLLTQVGDRGALENSVSFTIAPLLFNTATNVLELPLNLGMALNEVNTVLGTLVPSATFGLRLDVLPSVLIQFETSLLAGLFVGTSAVGGRVLENAIALGMTTSLAPEIVDYDLLISITSDLDLGLFASFETWLSKRLSGATDYTEEAGTSGAFTTKSGSATTFSSKNNKEDPGWQDGNVSEG